MKKIIIFLIVFLPLLSLAQTIEIQNLDVKERVTLDSTMKYNNKPINDTTVMLTDSTGLEFYAEIEELELLDITQVRFDSINTDKLIVGDSSIINFTAGDTGLTKEAADLLYGGFSSSGVTGLIQLSDGVGGFTSDSDFGWTTSRLTIGLTDRLRFGASDNNSAVYGNATQLFLKAGTKTWQVLEDYIGGVGGSFQINSFDNFGSVANVSYGFSSSPTTGFGREQDNTLPNPTAVPFIKLNGVRQVYWYENKTIFESEVVAVDTLEIDGYTIRFNESEGVHEFATAENGVVWQGALEDLVQIYNNTGETVLNGTPFFLAQSIGDTIATIGIASANLPTAIAFQGLVTGEIDDNDWGFGAVRGKVRGLNTIGLSKIGALFLSNDSLYTNTKPGPGSTVIIVGGVIRVHATEGIIYVSPSTSLKRQLKTKSYAFTSSGLASGEHWVSGFYDASATDITLNEGSLTQTYGTADVAYEAHPFVVCAGAGSVTGGGVVALVADGTGYVDDTGAQLPSHVDTIISDISIVALNEYYESEKYLGTTTYRLTVVSGAPSAYSLTFNYGYAKYDDINDRNFYITGLECVWTGNATDATGFDIELYKHTDTGWIYAASGFAPGNSVLAQRSVDQVGFLRVTSGEQSSWKRTMVNQFIEGSDIEGYLLKVTTGANSTIQIMDIHIEVAID